MIFYAQARGIRRETAIRLIVEGFFANVYDRITLEPVRETLRQAVAVEAGTLSPGHRSPTVDQPILDPPTVEPDATGARPMAEAYVHPEVLVSADWVEQHLDDPKVRIVESDEDVLLYDMGHIPGSVKIDWQGDLQDQLIRDYIDAEKFAAICSQAGIANDTTVVFYGDKSNWWACYALWAFKLFGHEDCRILNGGRKLWLDQKRPTTTEVPQLRRRPSTRSARRDESAIRAFRDEVLAHSKSGKPLLDVRSPKEFTGERTHMEDYPQEGSLRGGHIPAR